MINDITVSRCHATIKFENNHFVFRDNLSKFGTLVLLQKDFRLLPGQARYLQIGKTVVCAHMSYQAPAKYNASLQLWQEARDISSFWPNTQSEQKRNKQMKELY
jgi:hypothetical protein